MFKTLFPRPFGYRGQILRRLTLLFLCLALPSITACDYGQPKKQKSKFTQPPYETSKKITIEKARDIAALAPPEENISVEKVSLFKNNNERTQGMFKPKGLLTESLFTAPVSDETERFSRLENAVQSLSNKLNKMSPTIKRLAEIDRDLENLTYQLEILVNERESITKPKPQYRDAVLPTPAPAKQTEPEFREAAIPTPPQDIAPASGNAANETQLISGGSSGTATSGAFEKLRIADHAGKTRLVFEGAEKLDVLFNMNPNGRSANITVNNTSIDIDPLSLSRKSSLIKHATLKDNSLQLILNSKSKKMAQGYLPPTATNPNHRVYIDLKR